MRRGIRISLVVAALVAPILLGASAKRALAQQATQQLVEEAEKYYERGDEDSLRRSAEYFDRAIKSDPRGVKPEAYYKRASIFLIRKEPQKGINWLTTVAEKVYPGDVWIDRAKVVLLAQLPGRMKDAVDLAERVVARMPDAADNQIIIAEFYYNGGAGQADKTIAAYEAFLKHRPSELASIDKRVRVKLGYAYLHKDDFEKAEKQFDEALRASGPKWLDPNARKGQCAAKVGLAATTRNDKLWDPAITLCERVIKDKIGLRGDPSPYYNVGRAYLERNRYSEALAASNSFIGAKPKDPKGYLLRGKVYGKQNKWAQALNEFLTAKKWNPKSGEVARHIGAAHLRLGQPKLAIQELTTALQSDPNDVEILLDLSRAYYGAREYANAATAAERALAAPGGENNLQALLEAGKAHYAAGDLASARAKYEAAWKLSKANQEARVGLVNTINRQAAAKFEANDLNGTEALLREALVFDEDNINTNFNLGLVYLERGKFKDAVERLSIRAKRTPNDLLTNRLLAKAHLGAGNQGKAAEFYGKAENEARRLRNFPILGEIYTEWGPIVLGQGEVDRATEMLEQAAQYAVNQSYEKAARRNLQVALFHRGLARLKARNAQGAISDLEGATREPALLKGVEEDVFTFALGMAYLAGGEAKKAIELFEKLSKKGGRAAWLRPPFDALGIELFLAYAKYRSSESAAAEKAKAAGVFERLVAKASGKFQQKLRDLVRSAWELVAYEHFLRGNEGQAEASLKKAAAFAGANRRTIDHNEAVLSMAKRGAGAEAVFERLGDSPPEALVNLGILYDRKGESKKAFELWQQARSKGVRSSKLDEWIESKKRIFNF